jgi:hypothetical protein
VLLVSLVSLICHTPFVIKGQHVNWSSFSQRNVRNNRSWCVPFIISEQMLVQWWRLVAYMKATNLLHRAKRAIVPPHCDGHQYGQQRWYILHRCFVDCCHGGRWGNTEQVVAQWQRPVASDVAVDMGDAACTASTPPHGHRNGLQWRLTAHRRRYFVRHYL